MLDEKDKEIGNLNKDMTNIKERNMAILKESKKKKKIVKDLEKDKAKLQNDIKNLHATTGDLTKENTDLKAANSTLQALLEALDKNNDGTNEEDIEVTEVRKTKQMNKNLSGHLCVACDKRFKSNNDLENHIEAKHVVPECPLCEKLFDTKKSLESHVEKCMKELMVMEPCKHCSKQFTKPGLRRHINKGECQKKKDEFNCGECGLICMSANDLRQHMNNDHEQDRTREVCRHYRRGNCLRGSNCKFAHVGHQNTSQSAEQTNRPNNCRNGDDCRWFARGKCKFNHQGRQNNFAQSSQSTRAPHGNMSNESGRQCWYLNNCRRTPNCPYRHTSMTDFPSLPRAQRPPVWSTNNSQANH